MENKYILGVSVNTRCTGLAVFSGFDLIDYQLRLNKEKWSTFKCQKILSSLQSWCEQFNIKTIILSIPYAFHQTKEMDFLFREIKTFFHKKNIAIRSYTIQEILSFWGNTHKKKKETFKEAITTLYPELNRLLEKDRLNTSVYYSKLFEAVGVAHFYLQSLRSR